MKNLIKRISYKLLILIMLLGITAYFVISAFAVSASNESVKSEIKNQQAIRIEYENKEIKYTDQDKEYYSLKNELSKQKENTSNKADEIGSFITNYDEAMDYDVDNIPVFKEKQQFIKDRLSVFFDNKSFINTEDYSYTVMPEIYTTPVRDASGEVKGKYATVKNTIGWQRRDISRSYICQRSNGKIGVLLKVENYNKTDWEYQKLTIEKRENSYLITSFAIIYP